MNKEKMYFEYLFIYCSQSENNEYRGPNIKKHQIEN